ncbi:hypothetical protein Syun_016384 [Stephania yunnanensis]|uniref:Carboxypeptidase n=1 Tax=Stephania yunnanensis TaxID=152371 RepID=A0AAP0J4Q7_9MAGN
MKIPSLLVLLLFFNGGILTAKAASGTPDGSEQWGYARVRPKAHMFWWLYKSPYRVEDPNRPWPIVLWLQGGPGGSGVGIGNFQEVGPLDTDLKPRNSTWLRKADLLFVDNPVGTGFSFVEDTDALVTTDEEAATDLTTLLKEIFNKNLTLQKSPLYIVAESYGGKYAVTLGLSVLRAIEAGDLKLKLGGIALGDSWISPEDFVFSWGPLLKDVSRLDSNGLGLYEDATNSWSDLENVISMNSNSVRYSRYLDSMRATPGGDGDLDSLMNGPIRKKLNIIPPNVTWGGQSEDVFSALSGDFMKPRINEVDELLRKGVNVTVYNGQLDLICATKGTEAWIEKLKWEGLKEFQAADRTALYCGDDLTRGFFKSYKNLHFYWILEAGHFVPVDQPCLALKMVGNITQSPAP